MLPLAVLTAATALIPAAPAQSQELDESITAESLRAPLRFLSHDLLEGRGVGSRGDELSRLYLATQMQMFGLQPGGVEGSWEQPVPILGITAEVTQPMTVRSASGEQISFVAPQDYTAEAARPDPETAWRSAEVVFVGYGIHAPEEKWDDYKGDADLARGRSCWS